MIEFHLFDNLLDFIDELIILLNEDWQKFKLFFKKHKDYIIWLFIALITLQFTNVMSLGSSWNKYCKKNNIQTGGSNLPPASESAIAGSKAIDNQLAAANAKGKADLAALEQKHADQEAAGDKPEGNAPETKDKPEGNAPEGKDKPPEGGDEEDSVKSVDKKLGLFNKLKGKIKEGTGKFGAAGPVLGNLDGIFGAVEGMFTLIAAILIFIGIISLPVLVFLVITYCIIKMIVGKLVIY